MQTLQDFRAELKELEKKIDAKLAKEPEKGKNKWRPEYGEKYFFVGGDGYIFEAVRTDLRIDIDRLAHTPLFKTKEEAEFERERMKVCREIENWTTPFTHNEPNHFFYFDYRLNKVLIIDRIYLRYGGYYFASKQDALDCLEAVGKERIKKYYFGVIRWS